MSKATIGDDETTYPSLLDKEWKFEGHVRFLNGAKKRLAMTEEDFDTYRVIGGNCDHKNYDYNNIKVWKRTKRQPSRAEVQQFRQMDDIKNGTLGKFGLLKIQCVCGTQVAKYSLIKDVKLQWEPANKNEILVGNCCVKKFISPEAFDKVCECCKKVKIKSETKWMCKFCDLRFWKSKGQIKGLMRLLVFKELKQAVRYGRRQENYSLVMAVNLWDKQWEDEKRLKCANCPVLLPLDNPVWKNKCSECWKKEQCTKHGMHTCGCGREKFSWAIYCKSCVKQI